MEPTALLALSAFCQRVLNSGDDDVKEGLKLAKFLDLSALLAPLHCEADAMYAFVAEMLEEVIRALTPVAADETGFRVLCEEAQVAFIRTPAIKRWVKAGGPCRRRQEISEGDLIIGRLPKGRILSLSHCWDATCNCDPTGEKMRDLADELEALDAHEDEENGIFIDYCSLLQMAPRNAPLHLIGGAPLPERTAEETKRFSFALSEMSRMYAYGRCEVVVLKDSRPPNVFPDGSGEVLFREGATVELEGNTVWLLDAAGSRTTVKWVGGAKNGSGQKVVLGKVEGKVGEKLVAVEGAELGDASLTDFFLNCCGWGLARADKYEDRGWCVCEYTISKFNGRIANPNHIGVREVDDIRQWPTTVDAYEKMMDKKAARPVGFTFDSDRETVRFIFYRICFGMLHSFMPDEWHKVGAAGALPSAEKIAEAEALRVGKGDPRREYFLYVAATYPPVAAGDVRGAQAELLHGLSATALACREAWLQRKRYPVCVGDGAAEQVASDLKNGRIHCLVWAAGGVGWEKPQPQGPAPLTKQTLLQAYGAAAVPPPVVVVVMPHGARRTAEQLHAAGVRIVMWVGESLFDEDRANTVLFGLVVPVLSMLQQPGWWKASGADLSEMVRATGRNAFGSNTWANGGVVVPPQGLPVLPKWSPAEAQELWVHNLATSLPKRSARRSVLSGPLWRGAAHQSGAELHEALKLVALEGGKAACDLLERCTAKELCRWVGAALPDSQGRGERLVAALYADEEDGGGKVAAQPALQVRVKISDVGFLHELRDAVLTGTLEQTLSRGQLQGKSYQLSVDRSQFATAYEASVLSMDKLTPHQLLKLQECMKSGKDHYVHLQAPAGAGKTFVALNRLLELLHLEREARVLFVARNAALCYFVVRWVCRRVRNTLQRLAMLRRVHLLFEPFSAGPQAVQLEQGRIQMQSKPQEKGAPPYSMVVVDESHHIYKDKGLRDNVEQFVPQGCRRMLLSDISQSSGRDIVYPKGVQHVVQVPAPNPPPTARPHASDFIVSLENH